MKNLIKSMQRTRKDCLDFTVDGMPLPVPDGEVEISVTDLDSDDSGRDESGYLHRHRIREGVTTWSFFYATLTYTDYAYLESLFAGKETFEFVHRQPLPGVYQTKQCTAYRAKHSITLRDQQRGIYKNCKFNIIEC